MKEKRFRIGLFKVAFFVFVPFHMGRLLLHLEICQVLQLIAVHYSDGCMGRNPKLNKNELRLSVAKI
jgi:hypothetical protein